MAKKRSEFSKKFIKILGITIISAFAFIGIQGVISLFPDLTPGKKILISLLGVGLVPIIFKKLFKVNIG